VKNGSENEMLHKTPLYEWWRGTMGVGCFLVGVLEFMSEEEDRIFGREKNRA